jgi:acetyl esterase/lipase
MRLAFLALAGALVMTAASAPPNKSADKPADTPPPSGLVSYKDLLARPAQKPTERIAYGPHKEQFADLWLPAGHGPHPVIVLIHGGCWLASLPSVELMAPMAEALRDEGYAVWSLAYRRIGEEGGGYPGTFQDVAAGIDALRGLAPRYGLDLHRLVFSGHSAGGHLAVWAAQRDRLARTSPLYSANPLLPKAVVSLAGINDLEAYRAEGLDACGGPTTIDNLVDAAHRASPYADTSPARLPRPGAKLVVISGALDPIVPAKFGEAFAAHMGVKGETLPGAGHFELIDPRSAAWPAVRAALAQAH